MFKNVKNVEIYNEHKYTEAANGGLPGNGSDKFLIFFKFFLLFF